MVGEPDRKLSSGYVGQQVGPHLIKGGVKPAVNLDVFIRLAPRALMLTRTGVRQPILQLGFSPAESDDSRVGASEDKPLCSASIERVHGAVVMQQQRAALQRGRLALGQARKLRQPEGVHTALRVTRRLETPKTRHRWRFQVKGLAR